jgi:hypothetical protein
LRALPKKSLATEDQAENIEQRLPGGFLGFEQIAEHGLAFVGLEEPRSKFHEWPGDCGHDELPV